MSGALHAHERFHERDGGLNAVAILRLMRGAVPVLPDHLALLAELAALEWRDEKRRVIRRGLYWAVLVLAVLAFLLVLAGVVLALSWDTPQRLWCAVAVLGVFALIIAASAFALTRSASRGGSAFSATGAELRRDLELLRRMT